MGVEHLAEQCGAASHGGQDEGQLLTHRRRHRQWSGACGLKGAAAVGPVPFDKVEHDLHATRPGVVPERPGATRRGDLLGGAGCGEGVGESLSRLAGGAEDQDLLAFDAFGKDKKLVEAAAVGLEAGGAACGDLEDLGVEAGIVLPAHDVERKAAACVALALTVVVDQAAGVAAYTPGVIGLLAEPQALEVTRKVRHQEWPLPLLDPADRVGDPDVEADIL